MQSITDTIIRRIRAKQRGWVFTPKDLLDIGSRAAVDKVLSRLVAQGMIRRIDRGIYDFPKQHPLMGTLSPSSDDLARVIAAKSGATVQPSGAIAANLLGLSTQVPAKPVYLTNGPSRKRTIGKRTIQLKHSPVMPPAGTSPRVTAVVHGLLHMGQINVDDNMVQQCANVLHPDDRHDLLKMTHIVPGWMVPVLHQLAGMDTLKKYA